MAGLSPVLKLIPKTEIVPSIANSKCVPVAVKSGVEAPESCAPGFLSIIEKKRGDFFVKMTVKMLKKT